VSRPATALAAEVADQVGVMRALSLWPAEINQRLRREPRLMDALRVAHARAAEALRRQVFVGCLVVVDVRFSAGIEVMTRFCRR
jgi:hypothetical protein